MFQRAVPLRPRRRGGSLNGVGERVPWDLTVAVENIRRGPVPGLIERWMCPEPRSCSLRASLSFVAGSMCAGDALGVLQVEEGCGAKHDEDQRCDRPEPGCLKPPCSG